MSKDWIIALIGVSTFVICSLVIARAYKIIHAARRYRAEHPFPTLPRHTAIAIPKEHEIK